MSALGVQVNVLLGPGPLALPASVNLLEALEEIEIKHLLGGRSGFKIVFRGGRGGPADLLEDPLLLEPQLQLRARVVISVRIGTSMKSVFDGIVTVLQVTPGADEQLSMVEIGGQDLSVLMDLDVKTVEHPAQPSSLIITKLIANYANYGVIPKVVPPLSIDVPNPVERIPVQDETDYQYINRIKPSDHVFSITPGPVPLVSTAYVGPPIQMSVPQKALSINMAHETNCSNVTFAFDSVEPAQVSGKIMDRQTGTAVSVYSLVSPSIPLSTSMPTLSSGTRKIALKGTQGTTIAQAFASAQSQSDEKSQALTVTGELDVGSYDGVLETGKLVGLRGAGLMHDGLYFVHEVTHKIRPGSYSQSFTLKRQGLGTTVPVVMP